MVSRVPGKCPSAGFFFCVTYVCDIISGQENLSNRLIEMAEKAIPETDETALTDGGQGLELSEVLGATLNVHAAETNSDGARGDNDDTVAFLPELDCRIDDQRQNGQKRLMSLFVHNGTCACAWWWLARPFCTWYGGGGWQGRYGHDLRNHIWQVVFGRPMEGEGGSLEEISRDQATRNKKQIDRAETKTYRA